jgi:hypothetical protein
VKRDCRAGKVLCVLETVQERCFLFNLAMSKLVSEMELSHCVTVAGSGNIYGDVEGLPSGSV